MNASRPNFPAALTFGILLFYSSYANARCDNPAATLESAEGLVEWQSPQEQTWANAPSGTPFCYGDRVRVLTQRAVLRLANDTLLRLQENSVITLLPEDRGFWLELVEGAAHFLSRTSKQFTIKAPYLNAAVDGTEFIVSAASTSNRVAVLEGNVRVNNEFGEIQLADGMQTSATATTAPSPAQTIRVRDAAEWILYYPPLLAQATSPAIERLIENERYNDALDTLTKNALTAESATLAASLAFNSGQAEKAEQYLQSALEQNPQLADALALQALCTLIKGDDKEALAQTTRLVQTYPNNPSVLLVHAYAIQSQGEIENALTVNRQALELIPDNLFALARTAELELSAGNTSAARKLIDKALQKSPRHSRINTLAGFIALNRFATKDAQRYFQTAIETNSSEPLARFGLALALIQRGKIEQGRQQMEMAVLLDPGSSLLRSYLGKTYATQNKNDWADTQYQLAKNLDPNDPTPWFYSALKNQSQGNLIRAAKDLEESQSRNNNRLVYRSRFYLDRDAASRAANAGRIYSELGLTEKAIDLGTKAIREIPGEHSGHRLLAELYSRENRYESLRASERLQATMLQPVGTTPLPFGLSEVGLLVANGTGPSDLGFGEYTRLFINEGLRAQAGMSRGSRNTDAYNVNIVGTRSNTAVALGHYSYQTDGFRKNNDATYSISNLLAQWQTQPSFGIQAEISQREDKFGDLGLRFNLNNFNENQRTDADISTYRLGTNITTSKNGQLLVSLTKRYRYSDYNEKNNFSTVSRETSIKTDVLDFRYNHQYVSGNVIIGGLVADNQVDSLNTVSKELRNTSAHPEDLYAYHYIKPSAQLQIIYGTDLIRNPVTYSVGNLSLITDKKNKYFPKFGIQWTPINNIEVSAAYFETFSNNQAIRTSLKPTHILNFPQLTEGAEGITTDTYAANLTLRLWENTNIGYNYDTSDIIFPQLSIGQQLRIVEKELKSENHKLYFESLLSNSASVSIKASSEKTHRDRNPSSTDINLPLKFSNDNISFFLNWEIASKTRLTLANHYINQNFHTEGLVVPNIVNIPEINSSEYVFITDFDIYRNFSFGALKFSAKNLFDEKFKYADFDYFISNARPLEFFPELTLMISASINL